MALSGNHEDRVPRIAREDLDVLAAGLTRASRLVFAGLLLLALSLLGLTLATAGGADLLSDRRVHYALMTAIVLFYVYLQRD